MKTNQTKTIAFDWLPSIGCKFEITPLFFTKTKEVFGLDIKPLLAQWIRSRIEYLQKAQELGALTEQGQLDLESYQTTVQILTSC